MSKILSREKLVLTGNYASAYAVKQSRVEVIPAYPITPQTTIMEKLDEFIEMGELDAELIRVESEHSAMGAAIGSSAMGARTYTATSSQGLLYMYENIWWASNARLPIVATYVTRTLAPPWNIWSDHQDFYTLRDTGWILLVAKSSQEVYDLTIQAFKIAENERVRLPVGIVYDAFIISHTAEPVELLNQKEVDDFLPSPRNIKSILDVDNPLSVGNLPLPEQHFILRKNIWDGVNDSKETIYKVFNEYSEISGRDYKNMVDCYKCEDADTVFISLGAMAGEAIVTVDKLRKKGYKVGSMAIRVFRPFPNEELVKNLKDKSKIIVFSRGMTGGKSGVLYDEVVSTLYREKIYLDSYDILAGLAGTEVSEKDFMKVYLDSIEDVIRPSETLFIRRGEYV